MDRILVLDASWLPHAVVQWTKVVCLLWQEKAEVVEAGGRLVRSPSVELELPTIVRLRRWAPYRRRRLRPNRRNVLRRDDFTCQYCGRQLPASKLNLDHVVPRARGGGSGWENLVTACLRDNHRKACRTPAEAGMRLLRAPGAPAWSLAEEVRLDLGRIPEAWKAYLPATA